MSYQHKPSDTLYRGKTRWLRVPDDYVAKNGEEVIDTDEIIKKVPRNGFEITYLTYLFDLFDRLGGRKYQVLKYILQNKSADNTIIITTRELAKKCNVSTKTVIETRTGAIMLNPKIAHRGSDGTERYLLQKFSIFSDESE